MLIKVTLLIIILSNFLFAQFKLITLPNVKSEGNFYNKSGKLFTDVIVINFKEHVINTPLGEKNVQFSNINKKYKNFISLLQDLDAEYDLEKIVKQVPFAEWGDTLKLNRFTKKYVKVHDYSQLISLKFKVPFLIDSVISIFNMLPEVKYAHESVSIVYSVEPNDPKFQNGSQWNLDFIESEGAWDITRGSEDIAIGIVDDGVKNNHEDLQSKIKGGYLINGEHGTWVAGVAAASTDNSKGVASLGWNISLYTYGGYEHIGDYNYAVQGIISATETSDVINMSWMTGRYITSEIDLLEICPDCPSPNKWSPPSNPYVIVSISYPEIYSAISDAINQGVICVAAAGNSSKNFGPNPELCDPMWVPYIIYPAAYSDVIAVSGTKLNNSTEQFVDGWNYGYFVDICSPGKNIWTTDWGGDYKNVNGTSFSAPLVSALCGLIKTINPYFSITDVKSILFSTTDKIDNNRYPYDPQTGWNNHLGYGRINAHNGLLKALDFIAEENKSAYSSATFANNARHLVKDNGYLYEIFMSGNEIFFRRSNDNGSSWQVTKRLSGGNGSNSRPAISAFYDNSLHAVWQRKVGTNLWDIYYTYSADNGSSWSTPSVLAHNVQTTGSQNNGAQPVIAYCFVDEMYMELMTVYVSSSGIKYHTKTNATGAWSSASTLSGSYNSTTRFPSLSGGESYFTLVYDTRYYGVYSRTYDGSWTSETRVDWEGYYDRETCAAKEKQGGDMLAAFIARPSYSAPYSLYFRRGYSNNTWSSFKKRFDEVNGKDFRRPSLTYFDANYTNPFAVSILSHTSANRVVMHKYYAQFDSWSESDIAYDGREPSITGYDYASPKYCWTDQSDMPYLIKLSSNNLPKNSQSNYYNEIYARSAVIANGLDGSAQILEVSDYVVRTNSGKEYRIAFHKYPDDTLKLNLDNVWNYMDSEPVKLPADASELTYNKKIYTVFPNDSSGRQSGVSVFSAEEYRLAAVQAGTKSLLTVIDTQTKSGRVTVDISSLAGKEIVLYPSLEIAVKDKAELHFEFTDIYYPLDKKLEKLHSVQESLAKEDKPSSFALAGNYPNPFNPSTTIAFSLPEEGEANLAVYDLSGRLVKVLIKERLTAGRHTVQWQGRNASGATVASGVYIYRLRYNNRELAGKMLLLR